MDKINKLSKKIGIGEEVTENDEDENLSSTGKAKR